VRKVYNPSTHPLAFDGPTDSRLTRLENHMIADLTGTNALVTGSASGLGYGIAEVLAEQGAAVVVADLDGAGAKTAAGDIVKSGGKATAVQMDVTDADSVHSGIAAALDAHGSIDTLVNNAGVIGAPGWHERLAVTLEDWSFTFEVNVRGTVNVTEALEAHMTERGSGSVVNIASIAGKTGNPDRSSYNATKAAVLSYTQSMALRLAPHNITVNSICPGMIWTPMWDKISARQFAYGSEVFTELGEAETNRELFDRLIEFSTPLGRPQLPQDIGYAVAFLVSEQAGNITGQSLNVDGGRVMS
jgi:NAD(P)-dependent dehydrogenase (short-subunit alcohol dehydrogenase family)